MAIITADKPGTEVLSAGYVFSVAVTVGAGCIVQRIFGGQAIESVQVTTSQDFGPYLHDMTFRVSCLPGARVTTGERVSTEARGTSNIPGLSRAAGALQSAANTATINQQLAIAEAKGGSRLYIAEPGVYNLSSPIFLGDYTTLELGNGVFLKLDSTAAYAGVGGSGCPVVMTRAALAVPVLITSFAVATNNAAPFTTAVFINPVTHGTIVTSAPHGLKLGDWFMVGGATNDPAFNDHFCVFQVDSATQMQFIMPTYNAIPSSAAGTMKLAKATAGASVVGGIICPNFRSLQTAEDWRKIPVRFYNAVNCALHGVTFYDSPQVTLFEATRNCKATSLTYLEQCIGGVQVMGPARSMTVADINGYVVDDLTSLGLGWGGYTQFLLPTATFPGYITTEGNAYDVTFDQIRPQGAQDGVKLFDGSSAGGIMSRVSISDVRGTTYKNGVGISTSVSGSAWGSIRVDDVHVDYTGVPAAAQAGVVSLLVAGTSIEALQISRVTFGKNAAAAVDISGGNTSTSVYKDLRISGITTGSIDAASINANSSQSVVKVYACKVDKFNGHDASGFFNANQTNGVFLLDATMPDINISNVTGSSSNGCGNGVMFGTSFVGGTSNLTNINGSNLYTAVFSWSDTATLGDLNLANIVNVGANVSWGVRVDGGAKINYSGVKTNSGNGVWRLKTVGQTYELRGAGVIAGSADHIDYTTSQGTIKAYGPDMTTDVSKLARVSGALVVNTNAALGTLGAAGPVVCQGTAANSWRLMGDPTKQY